MPNYLRPRTSGPAKVNPDPPEPKTKFRVAGGYDPNHDRPRKKQLGEREVQATQPAPPRKSDRNKWVENL